MLSKIIKKVFKLFSYLLLLAFIVPVAVWMLIQFPGVEDYVISKSLEVFSEAVGTNIQYSEARVKNFNRIRFDDLLISDPKNDTVIFSKRTEAVMPVIFNFITKREPNQALIRKLILEDAKLILQKDSTEEINIRFLINYIKQNRDTTKIPKPFRIKEIELINSQFCLKVGNQEKETEGIQFSDMELNELNILTRDLFFYGDTVIIDIKRMDFVEKSGFQLESLTGLMELCSSYMYYSDIRILTERSDLHARNIDMEFVSFASFQPETLFEDVQFNFVFEEAKLNTIDIGFFANYFWNNKQQLDFEGRFYGPLSNLKGKDFSAGWGGASYISGDFSTNGLPDVRETFLIFDLKELVTNTKDLAALNIPGGKRVNLPANLEKLENFRYRGGFTGFLNDFVAYGLLTTNLGNIHTDLMFSPDSANRINFSGRVKTENFVLGKLFEDDELIGDIKMDAGISGVLTKDGPVSAKIDGKISRFTLKQYAYRNITIDGDISNRRFKGELDVNDPNLILQFNGLLDLAASPRQYDFTANVIDANLSELKISDSDPNYHASFLAHAKAEGQTLDELNGEISLLNSLFTKTNKQIQVYGLNFRITNKESFNEIILRSDILDADISGAYQLSALKSEFLNFISRFTPALVDQETIDEANFDALSHVDFNISFKRTQTFFDFFFPDYMVGENTSANGSFVASSDGYIKIDMFAPELKIRKNAWKGFMFNLWSEGNVLNASLGSSVFSLNERVDLENFTVETQTSSNKVDFNTRWLNWDSTLYKGNFSGGVNFLYSQPKLGLQIDVDSSELVISDSIWTLNSCSLAYDSSGLTINNIELSHDNQFLNSNGKLSDTPGDSLDFEFRNFDLANLNFFTRRKDFEFHGRVNGTGRLTGIKKNPLFFSSIGINDLILNGETLGNCYINSVWDNSKQSLNIDAEAHRGTLTMLRFSGDYFPGQNGKMDFVISLNKLKINVFNPFLSGVFSDMRGLASGDLTLTGFKGKPSLYGSLKLQKNALTVDYLKARYNFTTIVDVVNNNFIFNNVEMYDPEGNRGVINGMIRTTNLKDISLNLLIDAQGLLCLNTREYDNKYFYGTAYASGAIKIKGPPANLVFNIDAKTDQNTRFFIPLSEETDVSEYAYINFIRNDTLNEDAPIEVESNYQVDLSGIQMDFNLEVTPDAEVQIIFDSKMGDIIKAKGEGQMKMSVNTIGKFELIGEYTISRGEYLFTMQDVINKRLTIQDGSNLRWTGDPLNALIDITAVYRTRASLTDLYGDTETNTPGKVTVDCKINLKEQLKNPLVNYDLYLPYAQEDTRARVESKIGSEEELTKQFLALMVMNKFLPSEGRGDPGVANTAANNASELLSNQLSNWLSQINNDVDIGVNYRPGSGENSTNEVEVALSTQLLNDRLSINGSVGNNAKAKNVNNVMGDIDIDYKLTKNGKLRARTFFRTNDDQITTSSKYTAGAGMLYMGEFNTARELFGRKKKKQKLDEGKLEEEND